MSRYVHEVGDMLEYVTQYSTAYNITVQDKEGTDVVLGDTKTVCDMLDTLYWSRLFISKNESVQDAESQFEKVFKNFLKRRQKDFNLIYQSLYDYTYNPIENYNRMEVSDVVKGGTDTNTTREQSENSINYGSIDTREDNLSATAQSNATDTNTTTEQSENTISYGGIDTREDNLSATAQSNATDRNAGADIISKAVSGFNQPNTMNDSEKETTTYGKETSTTGTTTTTNTGTQKNTKSGTDSNNTESHKSIEVSYGGTETTTNTGTQKNTKSGTDSNNSESVKNSEMSYGGTEKTTSTIHGNIGVTTNQQMIESEIEMRKSNLLENIIEQFINFTTVFM